MKIVNGKAVFEEVKCWHCDGTKELKRYESCPNSDKRMSQSCKICGKTKEEPSHRFLSEYKVSCSTCGGKGIRLENRFDFDYQHTIATLSIETSNTIKLLFWEDSHLGLDSVFSVTDYGRHWKLAAEEFIQMIRKELSEGYHQFCKYVDKDNEVADKLVAIRKSNGYVILAYRE